MEEIKVGEYVRTKRGIGKIIPDGKNVVIDKNKRMLYVDKNGIPCDWEFSYYIWSNEIISHSKNLIDLIEEGDYVNGEKVVGRCDNCILILTDEGQTFLRNIFEDNDIKSIVTKEQFKSVEYIVGGKE